ncbi:hypothetical protein PVAND_006673 [Polypedilum vanderplanki]|uniref:C2H2-type domain-containing protein n=1 Tax=Polypedilum vanderplanki TaxID=319348 RepID=A0A9J6C4D0_POLVA|nr:hypothetical protein PVAND_006673 [Polypedilum vanderplanki]
MDNFYHQLPYSYYQHFPQIKTPILSNFMPTMSQTQKNNPIYVSNKQQEPTTQVKPIEAHQFKCHDCKEFLNSIDEFNSHIKQHDLKNRKHFKCNLCEKSYTQSSSLGFHKRKIHGTEIKKEIIQQKIIQNFNTCEKFDQIFECHRCNKQFSRPLSLKQHYLIHKEIKPHKCDVCDMAFSASSKLLLHKISHTNREPYRCNYCDKEFAISDHYRRHERIHTKEKPFKCDVCGRSFSQSNTLSQHQRIHTGVKPYSCNFCHKKFSVLNYLNNHLRTCKELIKSEASNLNYNANVK